MHFNRIGNVWNQQMPKEKLLNTTRKPKKLVLRPQNYKKLWLLGRSTLDNIVLSTVN